MIVGVDSSAHALKVLDRALEEAGGPVLSAAGVPITRGELASLILGSTNRRAIQLARCDFLVVKPDQV